MKVIDFAFFRVFDITCYFAAVNENRNTHIVKFVDYLKLLVTGVVAVADVLRHSSD